MAVTLTNANVVGSCRHPGFERFADRKRERRLTEDEYAVLGAALVLIALITVLAGLVKIWQPKDL